MGTCAMDVKYTDESGFGEIEKISAEELQGIIARCFKRLPQPDFRLMGGQEADGNEYPYTLAVLGEATNGKETICGGVLISPRIIMTARHCVTDLRQIKIRSGGTCGERGNWLNWQCLVLDSNTHHDITAIRYLPVDKSATKEQDAANDYAFIQLREAPEDTDYLCLRRMGKVPPSEVTVFGWGKHERRDVSNKLRYASLTTTLLPGMNAYTYCHRPFSCAIPKPGFPVTGIHDGDSGGPVVSGLGPGAMDVLELYGIIISHWTAEELTNGAYVSTFLDLANYRDEICSWTGLCLRGN